MGSVEVGPGQQTGQMMYCQNVGLTTECVLQYTALVDAHVPRLAACLGDCHELVRRQALALLANLLQKVRPVDTTLSPLPHTERRGVAVLSQLAHMGDFRLQYDQ